jgi:uracil-DNA glycosylase
MVDCAHIAVEAPRPFLRSLVLSVDSKLTVVVGAVSSHLMRTTEALAAFE